MALDNFTRLLIDVVFEKKVLAAGARLTYIQEDYQKA
jgi:hypothetical protein